MRKKIIICSILLIFLSITAFLIFFPYETLIKEKIEKSLGQDISIKKLKIKWNSILAEDFLLRTASGTEFLKIKELRIKLYFLALLRKEFDIKEIQIESPQLSLRKNKNGIWQLPLYKDGKQGESFQFNFKEIKITGGIIKIQDDLKGFNMNLEEVNISIRNHISPFKAETTEMTAFAKFTEGGNINLKTEGSIKKEQFKGTLSVRDLNIKVIRPYIKGNLTIKKGRLSLDTSFTVNKGIVKAPTILKAKNLEIESKGFLMGISAPLLIELLKKKDEITIPFNIWGTWNNLQTDLEVTIKRKVSEELGKTITSPLRTITKPLENILRN